jgi:colanic acid biosynthesis glycosyl transferase WcaI
MTGPASKTSRLIAVNRFFWPDHSATSQLLTDLATHLAGEGRPVTVIASRMLYVDPSVQLPARETRDGIDIRRLWTSRMGRTGLPGRVLDYLTFYVTALGALFAATRRGDVILVKTDPPLISVIAWIVARMRGVRLVTWNQDLFPEFAAALGISLAGGRFGAALRWLRNRSLMGAEINVAIDAPMADEIARQGVDRKRIRIIHNWSDAALHPVPAEDNPLRTAWGLDGAFVVAYSGNLGRAHIARQVTDLVRRTRDLPDLVWLFIGGGSGLVHIEQLITETGAGNIQIRPYQSLEDLSCSLSAADLHLVSLDPACAGLLTPSKLYGIMAVGRPTLLLADAGGTLAQEIAGKRIGVALDVARPETWRHQVDLLRSQPERAMEMGARARALSEAMYQSRYPLSAWSELLGQVLREDLRDGVMGVTERLDGEDPAVGNVTERSS